MLPCTFLSRQSNCIGKFLRHLRQLFASLLSPSAGCMDPARSGAEWQQAALEIGSSPSQRFEPYCGSDAGFSVRLLQAQATWSRFKRSEISWRQLQLHFLEDPSDNLASLLYLKATWHAVIDIAATDLEEQPLSLQLLEGACADVCTHLAQCAPLASSCSRTARSLRVRVALAAILEVLTGCPCQATISCIASPPLAQSCVRTTGWTPVTSSLLPGRSSCGRRWVDLFR